MERVIDPASVHLTDFFIKKGEKRMGKEVENQNYPLAHSSLLCYHPRIPMHSLTHPLVHTCTCTKCATHTHTNARARMHACTCTHALPSPSLSPLDSEHALPSLPHSLLSPPPPLSLSCLSSFSHPVRIHVSEDVPPVLRGDPFHMTQLLHHLIGERGVGGRGGGERGGGERRYSMREKDREEKGDGERVGGRC